jgi:hypothetical protein
MDDITALLTKGYSLFQLPDGHFVWLGYAGLGTRDTVQVNPAHEAEILRQISVGQLVILDHPQFEYWVQDEVRWVVLSSEAP